MVYEKILLSGADDVVTAVADKLHETNSIDVVKFAPDKYDKKCGLRWEHKCWLTIRIYKDPDEENPEDYKHYLYVLFNNNIHDTTRLISHIWELQSTGGALSRQYIQEMMQCGLIIRDGDAGSISNASYDLSLGDEYFYAGKIITMDDAHPFIAIEPYDYVIASCREFISMPRDVSGRFDISVNLFFQGIILSNSTQVDPGFRGKLFCLLFNTSNKTVYLKRGEHFTTIEFNKLIEPTTPYNGKYLDEKTIVPYLPTNIMQGAINELKKEIEKLEYKNDTMQNIYFASIAILLALITIIISLVI